MDSTIDSEQIIETKGYDFFRRDKNSHGVGVLIATKQFLHAKQIDLQTCDLEIIIIMLPLNTILCCLYRPNVSLTNVDDLNCVLSQIYKQYQNHNVVVVGNLNLPGIDWKENSVLPHFLEKGLIQIVKSLSHIHGNILDVVLVNDTEIIGSTGIISPGLSDHSIATVDLKLSTSADPTAHHMGIKNILIYREANQDTF